jgi:hypothetical protein
MNLFAALKIDSAYYSNSILADFNDLAVFLLAVNVDHGLVLIFVD